MSGHLFTSQSNRAASRCSKSLTTAGASNAVYSFPASSVALIFTGRPTLIGMTFVLMIFMVFGWSMVALACRAMVCRVFGLVEWGVSFYAACESVAHACGATSTHRLRPVPPCLPALPNRIHAAARRIGVYFNGHFHVVFLPKIVSGAFWLI
jgi:hypothetical protein